MFNQGGRQLIIESPLSGSPSIPKAATPNPVSRRSAVTGGFKDRLVKRAYGLYGTTDPDKFERMRERIRSLHAEHAQDLQRLGVDDGVNLWHQDRNVNVGLGAQVRRQIQHLDDYTPIKILVKAPK